MPYGEWGKEMKEINIEFEIKIQAETVNDAQCALEDMVALLREHGYNVPIVKVNDNAKHYKM